MTPKTARRILWIAALFTVPVPSYLGQPEFAPVVRLAFLSGLVTAVFVAEGGMLAGAMSAIGILQVLFFSGLLRLAAALVVRAAGRLGGAQTAVVLGLTVGLFGLSILGIYDTSLSSTRARSGLLQLFE